MAEFLQSRQEHTTAKKNWDIKQCRERGRYLTEIVFLGQSKGIRDACTGGNIIGLDRGGALKDGTYGYLITGTLRTTSNGPVDGVWRLT